MTIPVERYSSYDSSNFVSFDGNNHFLTILKKAVKIRQ